MHSHLNYSPVDGNSAKAICLVIFVVLLFAAVLPPYSSEASIVWSNTPSYALSTSDRNSPLKPPDAFGRLPLSFELNQGQTDSQVRFLARGQGYGLFLTTNGAVFSFDKPSTALRMYLQDAATSPLIRGVDELPGKVNYLLGRESDKWRTNIPTYARVSCEQIYPGVDLIYYGNQRQLEYDFVIAPGANFKQIRLAFDGSGKPRLNRQGNLIIKSGAHKITLLRPQAYQEIGKQRREISVRYLLDARGQVTFQMGDYDKSRQLIIDPVLVYSTFLGGSDQDRGNGIAVDSSGNAYIAGQTSSVNFPTGSPLQAAHAGGVQDAFVSKLNASGSALVYSTYLGGSGNELAMSIAVDNAGNAYITGLTTSNNFPILNALHPTLTGSNDGFIAELNASGSGLVYSTFLGGRGSDGGNSIAVDSLGNAYVTGSTSSRDFPTTNPLQASRSGNAIFKSIDGAGSWAASDSGLIAATVNDLKFHPSNSSIIYAATDTGVFKTVDAGVSWTALSGQTALPVNRVALDPTNTNVIYAATSGGVYKSTDGGNNFSAMNNGLGAISIRTIVIDPVTPTTLYATTGLSSYFRSIDGGTNWTQRFISGSGVVNSLTIDPNTPTTFYAATILGIFKSTDSGANWTQSNNGFPFSFNISSVTIDKTNNLLYAPTNFGIFKSADGANTWTNITDFSAFSVVSRIAIDPANSSIIYVATPLGLFKTVDGGATWNANGNGFPNSNVLSFVVDPGQASTLYIGTSSGSDAFVTKLSAGGTTQVYSTYLGGNAADVGSGIALDSGNNVYLTGSTNSSNFPTANALQPSISGGTDAFVAKLNSSGSGLVYSTFLGGDSTDVGAAIGVDGDGNAYIAGTTTSQDFPTANAFQSTSPSQTNEGFVTKLNPTGSSLIYSTYLGGDSPDTCSAIAVDAAGSAYVAGSTSSTNFPVAGAFQPELRGIDAFITKLTPSGSSLTYSTFLGGFSSDFGVGLALDQFQNVFVVGMTSSADFPTVNPLQQTFGGGNLDVFVAKLRPAPDLELTMTDSPDPVNFGSNLTYTINVKNNGEAAATGVTVNDTLPPGVTLVSATSTSGTCTGTTSINCSLGTINPGATAIVTVIVNPPGVRTIVNTATVTSSETNSFPPNNTATVQTLVDFADLSIDKKTAQSLVAPGSRITYSLIVKNKSGIPAAVTVTDNLPAGTALLKCTPAGNVVCGGSGNKVSVLFPQLAVGASEVVLLTVEVSGSEGSIINNTATVSSPVPDPDSSNNSATASVAVAAVPVLQKSNGVIAFATLRDSTQPSGIYTMKPDGTDEKLLPNTPTFARRPAWSPDGTRLAFEIDTFGVIGFLNLIRIINADGTGLLTIANNVSDSNRALTWSPNGSQIAYIGSGDPNSAGTAETVHIVNTDGSGNYRLPGSPTDLTSVDWSPDGTKFVYSNGVEIFVMNADATGQTKLTTVQQTNDGETRDTEAHWSPDGKKILLRRATLNSGTIYVMNADGSNLTKFFNFNTGSFSPSADGLTVVFEQFNEICTVNLNGTNFKCLTNNNHFSNTSPNWQRLPNPNPTPTPTPEPAFSLSGRVTADKQLVLGEVSLTGPINATVITDTSGNYSFANLPAGQYTLTPISIAHTFNPPSRAVTITNANITGLDFAGTFVPANITGHVKDNNGHPLAGIRIRLRGDFPESSTFTDANGFYSFPDLQRFRDYFINPDSFTPYRFEPGIEQIQNLTSSKVVDIVGIRQPTNVINGRVVEAITGQGIGGIEVSMIQDVVFFAGSTITDANGNFSFGERQSNHTVSFSVSDDQIYIFSPKIDPTVQVAQIFIPLLLSDQNLLFTGVRRNTVQFSVAAPSVNEDNGSLEIAVTRTGDVASPATVNFATADMAGLTACNVRSGKASERCDYGSTVGTLRFAAGETSKSFVIPIVNDATIEGNETFTIALTGPIGAQLGATANATVTINDNDTTLTQNPIDGIEPFVTQQYIDFLGRLPDTVGFANWVTTLNGCPNGGFGENDNPSCDRVHVSAGFFLSDEFRGRGYWAYRFYEVGFDRRPLYAEFVPDMAQVGGAQSPASELLSKAAYTDAFVQRSEFTSRYNSLTNSAYVNTLEQNAEITLSNKASLIGALDANQKTRGAVLREIVESKAVEDQFFIRAFVAMQYFGYLRRDPDTIGYNNWVNTLTAEPNNFRHMIFGFLFSTEYRGRFGP